MLRRPQSTRQLIILIIGIALAAAVAIGWGYMSLQMSSDAMAEPARLLQLFS